MTRTRSESKTLSLFFLSVCSGGFIFTISRTLLSPVVLQNQKERRMMNNVDKTAEVFQAAVNNVNFNTTVPGLNISHLLLSPASYQDNKEEVFNNDNVDEEAKVSPAAINATVNTTVPSIAQLSYCEANNFLPQAGDTEIAKHANNTRRFSIRKQDFEPTHSNSCGSSDEILQAISMGQRRWDVDVENMNLTLLQKEDHPSSFIPHQCSIPYYQPDQICNVLNRFSHVIIQGDSLGRHLQGGLLMALRGDIVKGSIESSKKDMYKCQCDAQFSEHPKCRGNNGLYNRFRPHQLGLCPNLDLDLDGNNGTQQQQQFESVFNINRLHKGVYKFSGVNCTSPESRGILVIVQGGVHMKYNPKTTYQTLIRPFFKDPIFRTCSEQNKAMFIFTSYTAQSPSYDDLYPMQKMGRGLKFNDGVNGIFKNKGINATVVDWLNFTIGAQHSDGLHYAAQVNLFKAQHLIALVDHLWDEKKFFKLPNTS